ncbi:GIY-YIG nuclease family protein [Puniceicoccaceae bacterium K14]|nr:GIY-YIG nuclease family protein [Puniceicoccaceae bacterium K14]
MSRRSPAGQRRTVYSIPINLKTTAGMPSSTFHYVYILINEDSTPKRYVGITTDLNARLKKHNSGSVTHTKKHLISNAR